MVNNCNHIPHIISSLFEALTRRYVGVYSSHTSSIRRVKCKRIA